MIKQFFSKHLHDEFVLNKAAMLGLIFIAILSAAVIYDNPSVFSALLFCFSIFLITQTYFYNKIYRAAAGLKVSDIMVPLSMLQTLNHATHASKALDVISKSFQEVYPVFYNDNFYGIIEKDRFLSAISSGALDAYVSDFTEKKFDFIHADESIQKILSSGRLKAARVLAVFNKDNGFVGLLSYEKLIEFVLIEKVIKEAKKKEVQDEFFL